jgi:lipoprotein-anchoring transpeptidase ErfK/SrfK
VRSLVVLFMIIGGVVAGQALAEDTAPQPLTRADCQAASGWSWNETANVCGAGPKTARTAPDTAAKPQPLTKNDCDLAGMSWNDKALVCDEKPASSAAAAATKATSPVGSSILIDIDKSTQKMTVSVDGVEKYSWPVSTGRRGFSTPSGSFTPLSMNEVWYSKEWDNAPMPHAIFFMKDGHAIHGSYEVKQLGKPVSHGCVRVAPQNATILYDLVKKNGLQNTQVVLSGESPGGESKVANAGKTRSASHPWPGNGYFTDSAQPRERGGFFRRLFGAR